MANEIRQKLSFDASAAIAAINQLSDVIPKFGSALEALSTKLTSFNSLGSATSGVLKGMATDANAAATAFERLAKAKSSAGATPKTSAPADPGREAAVQAQIAALRSSFGEVPADASAGKLRSFQSAITSAAEFAVKTKASISDVNAVQQNLTSSFTGNSNILANRLAQIQRAFQSTFSDSSRAVKGLTIDFQTFVRIVGTQVEAD